MSPKISSRKVALPHSCRNVTKDLRTNKVEKSCVSLPIQLLFEISVCAIIVYFYGVSADYIEYTVFNASTRGALCNDGTPAVYYIDIPLASNGSFWLIYLEGGGYCDSLWSCDIRNATSPYFMTSSGLPPVVSSVIIPGLLSDDCTSNPAFCTAIKVYLHYCSSDVWAGSGGIQGPWQFNGRNIVRAVIEDLLVFHNLKNDLTTTILYAGSSAGGVGITHTIDWIKNLFFSQAAFFGFNDAGFAVNYPPYSPFGTSFATLAQTGWSFWNVTLEGSPCVPQYPNEPWRCIMGPDPIEASQQPLFTFSALYDQVILSILGTLMPPNNADAANYSIGYGMVVHSTLCNLSKPFFSHSGCVHTIALSNAIANLTINGNSMYATLVDWFFGLNRLPHRVVENVECYCTRMYNCNPTDPCEPGPGYQNGCTYQPCSNTNGGSPQAVPSFPMSSNPIPPLVSSSALVSTLTMTWPSFLTMMVLILFGAWNL